MIPPPMEDLVFVRYPHGQGAAREWIANTVLGRMFRRVRCYAEERQDWSISLHPTEDGREPEPRIEMPDAFFPSLEAGMSTGVWCGHAPLRVIRPREWPGAPSNAVAELPVLFGTDEWSVSGGRGARLGLDVLGSACFMLARYEELTSSARDAHDRFPAPASASHRFGFLSRPLIDEYIELLWEVMRAVWPRLQRRAPQFRVMPSHDVDEPSRYAFRPPGEVVRESMGDVFKRRDLQRAMLGMKCWLRGRQELHPQDPYNTFNWLMDQSESHGVRSTFYFAGGSTNARFDPNYPLTHAAIRQLLVRVHQRGHEIGLHPSYDTGSRPTALREEADQLRNVCARTGIDQGGMGARMHYLRWHCASSPRALAEVGCTHDASLGFADRPGFRCGTCQEYEAFDPVTNTLAGIRMRPLVAMDVSVTSTHYMGLGTGAQAYEQFAAVKRACRSVGGDFSLLWHNNELRSEPARALYQAVLQA